MYSVGVKKQIEKLIHNVAFGFIYCQKKDFRVNECKTILYD